MESTPDQPNGSESSLVIDAGADVHVRFELPDLAADDLMHAKLSLLADPLAAPGEVEAHLASQEPWDEADPTWNSSPTVGVSIATTGRFSRGSAMSVAVSDVVRDALSDGAINLVLRGLSPTVIGSEESGDGPRLVLSVREAAPVLDDAGVDNDAGTRVDGGMISAGCGLVGIGWVSCRWWSPDAARLVAVVDLATTEVLTRSARPKNLRRIPDRTRAGER